MKNSKSVDQYKAELAMEAPLTLTFREWSVLALGFRFVKDAVCGFMEQDECPSLMSHMSRNASEHLAVEIKDVYLKLGEIIQEITPDPPGPEKIKEHYAREAETLAPGESLEVISLDLDGDTEIEYFGAGSTKTPMDGGKVIPEA